MPSNNRNNLLVSVILTTKNEEKNITACIKSIKKQNYPNIEIIVVDNNSTDNTKKIAKRYTKHVFNKGPERSAQRNFGAKKAKGEFLLFIDSDMELSKNVIKECVEKYEAANDKKVGGIIIPEKSFGKGFWAQCKILERSFYIGVDEIEACRFFSREYFNKIGGYDENLVSGEDWDLSNRIRRSKEITRIKTYIYHNEGNLSYFNLMRKKMYYSSAFNAYIKKHADKNVVKIVFDRFRIFFSNPIRLFKNPLVGLGMLFMVLSEFSFGGIGYVMKKFQKINLN